MDLSQMDPRLFEKKWKNEKQKNERNETKRTTGEDTYAGGETPPSRRLPRSFVSFRFVRFVSFCLFCSFEFGFDFDFDFDFGFGFDFDFDFDLDFDFAFDFDSLTSTCIQFDLCDRVNTLPNTQIGRKVEGRTPALGIYFWAGSKVEPLRPPGIIFAPGRKSKAVH